MRNWVRFAALGALLSAQAIVACGGASLEAPDSDSGYDSGSADAVCPPGFVCYPLDAGTETAPDTGMPSSCPSGYLCTPLDATTGVAMDGTLEAGETGSETGLDSAAPEADAPSNATADAADAAEDSMTVPDASEDAPPASDAGVVCSVASGDAAPSTWGPLVLSYSVVDAKQSAALASIVIVSDTPTNALHVFDEVTEDDRSVALPAPPVAVSVDPSGLYAAVAYDANVSWVDLRTATLLKTCPLGSNASGIALTTSGLAYVVPASDQWVPLHVVDLVACSDTTVSQIWAGASIALHPSGLAAFTTEYLDPSRILRCNVAAAPAACTDSENYADWGTYSYGNNLWISADGQRIYTATGVTLRVPGNVNGSPAYYGGTLTGVTSVVQMAEAPCVGEVALIPGSADGTIRIHETSFLGFVNQFNLPTFPIGEGGSAAAHGKFVFTDGALDVVYVVVQADPSSGALNNYAIEALAP